MSLPNLGEIWDGKYRIERVLGEGGMGVVFEAYHLRLEQQVAIKCLLPEFADSVAVKARFEREARAAARLRSRHVVKILDVETHPSGVPYMVMELMRGRDLDNESVIRGDIPYPELCDWLVQAAGALAEAHKAGIVHRDLKPSNIFIAEEPGERVAKVLDFGIAKSAAIVPGITYSTAGGGGICGTPQYMSPEQITDNDVDGRADVWALGVLAYELLAKRPPFTAQSFTALAVKIANDRAPNLAGVRPDLPPALSEAVMRCLEKDRSLRFQGMTQFAEALAPFGTRTDLMRWSGGSMPAIPSSPSFADLGSGPSLLPNAPKARGSANPGPSTLLGQTLAEHKPGKSKTIAWVAAVATLALLGATAFVVLQRKPPEVVREIPTPASSPVASATTISALVATAAETSQGALTPSIAPPSRTLETVKIPPKTGIFPSARPTARPTATTPATTRPAPKTSATGQTQIL